MAKAEGSLSKEYVYDSDSDIDQEAPVYEPPRHFHRLKSSKGAKATSKALENKEIWLFKLPQSLDLKQISQLPIQKETSGTVFKHTDGKSYRITQELFAQDLSTNKYSVLVPFKDDSYRVDKGLKVQRIFTISETVEIPQIDIKAVKVARSDVPKEEHLRMRHFPTGYGADDFEEAKPVEVVNRIKKRKAVDGDVDAKKEKKKEKREKKEKKSKKEKKHKE